jgi:hypothetical protein
MATAPGGAAAAAVRAAAAVDGGAGAEDANAVATVVQRSRANAISNVSEIYGCAVVRTQAGRRSLVVAESTNARPLPSRPAPTKPSCAPATATTSWPSSAPRCSAAASTPPPAPPPRCCRPTPSPSTRASYWARAGSAARRARPRSCGRRWSCCGGTGRRTSRCGGGVAWRGAAGRLLEEEEERWALTIVHTHKHTQLRRFLRKAVHLFAPLPAEKDAALSELAIALWQQV